MLYATLQLFSIDVTMGGRKNKNGLFEMQLVIFFCDLIFSE